MSSIIFKGDSGGPFMVQDEDTHQWKLFGIISFAYNDDCNSKDYGIFTDVTKFTDWIRMSLNTIQGVTDFLCHSTLETISISQICDGKSDCADASDERHCGE